MISFLEGTLAEKSGDRVVIGVQGTGYEVLAPSATIAKLPPVGKTTKVYTRLHVRDDALTLYGFASPDERALFDLLVTVNGVGPKVALAFLSVLTPDALRRAVGGGDVDALTIVPGVGKKVAQRVVLDLKERIGGDAQVASGPLADVREALLALGLSAQEARDAMATLQGNGDRPVDDMLREALRNVGRA
jgi:Holliday junction DNA helicase RuvA